MTRSSRPAHKPGEKADRSGQNPIVGPRGGQVGEERTVTRGEPVSAHTGERPGIRSAGSDQAPSPVADAMGAELISTPMAGVRRRAPQGAAGPARPREPKPRCGFETSVWRRSGCNSASQAGPLELGVRDATPRIRQLHARG